MPIVRHVTGAEDIQRSGQQLSQTGWRLIRFALLLVSTAGVLWVGQHVLWLSLLLGFLLLAVAALWGFLVGPAKIEDGLDQSELQRSYRSWNDERLHMTRHGDVVWVSDRRDDPPQQYVESVTALISARRVWLMVLLSAGALTWMIYSFSGASTQSPPAPPVMVTVTVTATAPSASPQPVAAEQASTVRPTDWIAAVAGALGAVGGVAGGIGAILAARGSMMSAKAALLSAEAQQRPSPKP
jgi:hypothetical protein